MTTIADHLRALVEHEEIPEAALTALVARIDEAAPPLRDLLAKATAGTRLSDEEAALFFFGLHILAAGRDTQAFAPLLAFLKRPSGEIDDLLGDAGVLTLPRVAASLFDGDAEALFATIRDMAVVDDVRDALLGAAIFLTWKGRIPLATMRAFLVGFEEAPAAPDGDLAWIGFVQAVALLGLRDLMPRVMRVFARKRLPEDSLELRDVEEALRDAERAPADGERFAAASLGTVDDVVETMRWLEELEAQEAGEPVLNPYRDVGRNDPCPCGSGKKFKKCCLAEA